MSLKKIQIIDKNINQFIKKKIKNIEMIKYWMTLNIHDSVHESKLI